MFAADWERKHGKVGLSNYVDSRMDSTSFVPSP